MKYLQTQLAIVEKPIRKATLHRQCMDNVKLMYES